MKPVTDLFATTTVGVGADGKLEGVIVGNAVLEGFGVGTVGLTVVGADGATIGPAVGAIVTVGVGVAVGVGVGVGVGVATEPT